MSYTNYSIREVRLPEKEGSTVLIPTFELWGHLEEKGFVPDAERACTRSFYRDNWVLLGTFLSLAEAEEGMRKFIKEVIPTIPVFKEYGPSGKERTFTNYYGDSTDERS